MSLKSIFSIATSRDHADRIVDQLKAGNFSDNDISALFADKEKTHDFAQENHTQAPETAIAGASESGGGAFSWLAGIGALAIPGVGAFFAAGPIAGALSDKSVDAAVGGVAGGLIGMGIPESEAKLYEGKITAGDILISVHTANTEEISRAHHIFTKVGAQHICIAGEAPVSKDPEAAGPKSNSPEDLAGELALINQRLAVATKKLQNAKIDDP